MTSTIGRILIDGTEIHKISLKSIRQSISIVLQDPFLFSETVPKISVMGV